MPPPDLGGTRVDLPGAMTPMPDFAPALADLALQGVALATAALLRRIAVRLGVLAPGLPVGAVPPHTPAAPLATNLRRVRHAAGRGG